MLFPCPEGSVVGKSFQSEVEVRLKAKSRCEMRPEVSPAAAQIVSFLAVPAATFDTEDHPSTGQKTSFLSSPGHAVSLFWRLRFGKPRWSEVEVCLKAKSRCEIRPEVSPPAQVSEVSPAAAQIVSFLAVPAATFDTEDHPSTGQKTSFLSSPGHAVSLFWRLRHRSTSQKTGSWARQAWVLGSLDGQKSKCISKPSPGGPEQALKRQKAFFFFNRFRPQRLTLKITPAQVSEVSPAAAQIVSFLAVPAATFDTEDHPSTGQKTSFLSSPGHAVSLFWRLRFGKPRWSEVEVCLKAKSRCEIRPEVSPPAQVSEVSPAAAQIVSFLAVPAATFDTEDHPSTGQKTSFLSSPGHAVSLFWRLRHRSTGQKTGSWARQAWVLGSLDGQKSKCISKPSPGAK